MSAPPTRAYLGIDPGASGGMALITEQGRAVAFSVFKDASPEDICADFKKVLQFGLDRIGPLEVAGAALELVHAMPKQGVSSTFKFGVSYGVLQASLAWAGVRYDLVTPRKWQVALGCLSKGNKNVTKAAAQRLFAPLKVTHANADAFLLAEYARSHGTWKVVPDGNV